MRNTRNAFHLAIPVRDLDEALEFYVFGLGCKLARRYDDRITLDFFGDQVVCHLDPGAISKDTTPYPRHFGVTFYERAEFDSLHKLCELRKLKILAGPERRFKDTAEEHLTMMLADPSNNVIEFKYYFDPRMMY